MRESFKKAMTISPRVLSMWEQEGRVRCCALCKSKLISDDAVYLVTNNYKFFPNCFVHIRCWDSWSDYELSRGWEDAQKYQHWFI